MRIYFIVIGNEKNRKGQSETTFRRLFETAQDGILILDANVGGITQVNPYLKNLLGYSEIELLGKKLWDIGLFEDQQRSVAAFKELKKNGYVRYEDLPLKAKNGQRRDVEFINNVYRVNGENVIQCNIRDISERKRNENVLADSTESLKATIKELSQRSHEMGLLSEMGDSLHTCVSLEEVFRVVARFSVQLLPGTQGVLYTMNAVQNRIEVANEWGGSLSGEDEFVPNDCVGLRRGRVHSINGKESSSTLKCQHLAQPALNYLCAPMIAHGEIQGVYHLRRGEGASGAAVKAITPFNFEEPNIGLVGTMADTIALALANLKLRDALRQQSILDPLTGLYNRRYMKEALERELRRANRNINPLGIIMFDIDHFKKVNDSFGHEIGDAILRALGKFVKTKTRGNDIPCRYGGEEFLLVLPKISLSECAKRAEKFRQDVKCMDGRENGKSLPPITLSIGISEYPTHGDNVPDLLNVADKALYRAKSMGRDRIEMGRKGVALPVEPNKNAQLSY